ncbi:jacalin-like lectin [Methanocorpusculum sp. MG]|uniref:Jacalin-like lectin n=1 Tax=Methanocorpusculum petauri TaxID=3002863 RepID=A0ABT4IHH5_9EURY|nr:DUF6765 family protein [Methanocorpusculum petauri]MCZ0861197.1 jacalin-like lectin [Methanocorpusculum petauri]MDE2442880.1 jacalin-like lectin [Methanocorpusculum sp.]
MNIDFHYYGTYLAARLAGYTKQDAETIAYAAQYVDESSKDMIVPESSGLMQVPTVETLEESMKYGKDPRPWTREQLSYIRRTWMCFHFLPGNISVSMPYQGKKSSTGFVDSWSYDAFEEQNFKFMCLPNSELVVRMIQDIQLNHRDAGYALQMIGLRMHVMADTWAHMYFAGRPAWYVNDVEGKVEEYDGDGWHPLTFIYTADDNVEKRLYSCTPTMPRYSAIAYHGHGRMGHLPDYGFMRYRYSPQWRSSASASEKILEKDNPEVFLHAFQQMVYALKCIREDTNKFQAGVYDSALTEELRRVFQSRTLDQSQQWIALIKSHLGTTEVPKDFQKNAWKDEFIRSGKSGSTPYYYFAISANRHYEFVDHYLTEKGLPLYEMEKGSEEVGAFGDYAVFCRKSRVSKIRVRTGSIVDAVQVVYDDEYQSDWHGNAWGGEVQEFNLNPGEYISAIDGAIVSYTGAYPTPAKSVSYLRFTTSTGRTFLCGNPRSGPVLKSLSYLAGSNMKIFTISGQYVRRYLNSTPKKGNTVVYLNDLAFEGASGS